MKPSLFSFENIYRAYRACIRNKRGTLNALRFEADLVENLWNLHEELSLGRYRPGASICFLTRSPKLREVFAADFKDRVAHHLLVGALEPFYEPKFIHDVYNNRKNRGIHAALRRTELFARRYHRGYALQLDIKGFFYAIDKNRLFKRLFDDLRNSTIAHREEILYLANRIIYHDPTRRVRFKGDRSLLELLPPHKTLFKLPKHLGLPIGNLTSQFFANVYLNPFDHFVKRELKAKAYLRYVDDFVLFAETKAQLLAWRERIAHYLEAQLGLRLRDAGRLRPVTQGIDFLGYIIRPHYTLVRRRVVRNFKMKKRRYLDAYEAKKGKMGLAEIKKFLSVQASFTGHCAHADSFNLLKKVGTIHDTDPFGYDDRRCVGTLGGLQP